MQALFGESLKPLLEDITPQFDIAGMQIQFKSPRDLFLFVTELDNLVVNFIWKLNQMITNKEMEDG